MATHDDGSAIEAVPLREGLVRIEAGRVARSLALYRLPGIGGMERSLAVLGAVNPVGEIPASQHRDRPLDHAHVHVLENASQRPAIAAAKIRKDRDGRARRIPPDDRSEEHTSELQQLMRTSYAVSCLTNTINTQ